MTIYFIIIGMLLWLCILGLVRNELVYKIRQKARDMVFREETMPYKVYNAQSYDAMWRNVLKWRFKDFYPGYEKNGKT